MPIELVPLFKEYMPANPRKAILAVVEGIDGAIVGYQSAVGIDKVLLGLFSAGLVSYLLNKIGIFKIISNILTRKDRANAAFLKHKLAVVNLNSRLLEIDNEAILPFYTELYPDNFAVVAANRDRLDLAALCAKLNDAIVFAQVLIITEKYQEVLELFATSQRQTLVSGEEIKFSDIEESIAVIDARIGVLKGQILEIEAAKGNVQAPPKPAPSTPKPRPGHVPPARLRLVETTAAPTRTDWGSDGDDY